MKTVITDATTRQATDLAARLENTTRESRVHRDEINRILTDRFGEEYTKNPLAIEYFDKHANNVGPLAMAALLMNMSLPKLGDPEMQDTLAEALTTVARWTTTPSDKPSSPSETRAMAMTRTLAAVESFVGEHRADFGRVDTLDELNEHMHALRDNMRSLMTQADTAKRLSQTIMPTGASLATSA